jgi:hypothetical protein
MRAPDDGMTTEERDIFEYVRSTFEEHGTAAPDRSDKKHFMQDVVEEILARNWEALSYPEDSAERKAAEEFIAAEARRLGYHDDGDLWRMLTKELVAQGLLVVLPVLREFIVDNLERPPPPAPRGAPPRIGRDIEIATTIEAIVEDWPFIRPTRRGDRHGTGTPHSACSIVTAALVSLGANLTESAVEAIWHRRDVVCGRSPPAHADEPSPE